MQKYDQIISNITDYYLEVLEASMTRAVPPTVSFGEYDCEPHCVLNIYCAEVTDNGGIRELKFFCTRQIKNGCRFFGRLPFHLYKTLESELEEAQAEYRRVHFKRLSRKQRHLEG